MDDLLPASAFKGCGVLLAIGDHIVTRCGCRPATMGGATVALCPDCVVRLEMLRDGKGLPS